MPIAIGTSSGNRDLLDIHVGTASGVKAVAEVWVGTTGGARMVYTAVPPIPPLTGFCNDGFWQYNGGYSYTWMFSGSLTVNVSGGVAPYFYDWGSSARFGTQNYASAAFEQVNGDPYAYDETFTCTVWDSAEPPNQIEISGTVRS